MTLRDDGHHHCDRCGRDVGNGGIDQCAKAADLAADDSGATSVVNYEWCRASRTGAPHGCAGLIIGPAAVADYTARHG